MLFRPDFGRDWWRKGVIAASRLDIREILNSSSSKSCQILYNVDCKTAHIIFALEKLKMGFVRSLRKATDKKRAIIIFISFFKFNYSK